MYIDVYHIILNLPHTRGLSTLLGNRVAASKAEVSNALYQVATDRIYSALRGQQRGTLSGCFLYPKEPDVGSIPNTNGAWRRTRSGANDHFTGEDESPKKRLIPTHRQCRPFKGLGTDRGRLRGDALDLGLFREGWKVVDQGASLGARCRLECCPGDVGCDGGDDGEDRMQRKLRKPRFKLGRLGEYGCLLNNDQKLTQATVGMKPVEDVVNKADMLV